MTSEAAVWQPLRRRGFALLWTSQVVSGFGDRITLIGLAYLSWVVTGSTLVTALAVVVSTVPHAILGLFAGSFADAYGRRRAMVVCDVGRAIVVGLDTVRRRELLPAAREEAQQRDEERRADDRPQHGEALAVDDDDEDLRQVQPARDPHPEERAAVARDEARSVQPRAPCPNT